MQTTTSKLIIAMLILISTTSAFAQWNMIQQNNYIYGSCFATTADTCFFAGANGIIYQTPDGGSNWNSAQSIFTTSWFNDVYFTSSTTGYACGGTAFGMHTSIIAKTTNGGQTWDSLTANNFGYEFRKIFFVNDSVGFAVGDNFVRTTDGGLTFSLMNIPFNGALTALYFFNSTTGVIATREYVSASKLRYRVANTTDGGLNWTTSYLDSVNNASTIWNSKIINDIHFINSSVGFAVRDNGNYLQTANGGLSWTAASITNDSTNLNDITISSTSGVGYIACSKYTGTISQSRIYKTTDYGLSWQENFNTSLISGLYSVSLCLCQNLIN